MPVKAYDIAIVGGGIMGLLTAFELRHSGMQIAIIDSGLCGKEASWAGGGIVSPLYPWRYPDPVSALAAHSQGNYQSLCAELKGLTQIDPEWIQSGLLIQRINDFEEVVDWASKFKVQSEILSVQEASDKEPALTHNEQAIYFPHVAQVRNPRLLKALVALAHQSKYIDVLEHFSVSQITPELNGTWRVVNNEESVITTKQLIVCAGAWTSRLLSSLGINFSVHPMRGQMIMFAPFQHTLKSIVLSDGRYLIPRSDGRILCGSTLENVGFVKETTEEALSSLYHSATQMMPSLKDFTPEAHWAGLRPGSRKGIPFIGEVPGFEGLWVNAGHFRNGVVLAPGACRLLRNLILKETPIVDPKPYQP